MHHFHYVNGELHCEEVPLARIAAEVGTPAYVYSQETLVRHFRAFDEAFQGSDHLVCYSAKSNSNLAILRLFGSLGGGVDIVSGGELFRALKAGIPSSRIVYSGVGKTEQEIDMALRAGILMFNIESSQELDVIDARAGALGCRAPVALRVNPDVDPQTHPYISTGLKKNKFGIDIQKVLEDYRKARSMANVEVVGVDCHIGSQIIQVEPFVDALHRLKDLMVRLRGEGIGVRYLDMGGGLGITYDEEAPPHPTDYAQAIMAVTGDLGCTLILEPGRVIVGNAGILLSRVLYTKEGETKRFVIVDAGMNDLVRPSLYGSYHRIQAVHSWVAEKEREADLVGPICESADFLARDRRMPAFRRGDLVAVMSAGAYGFSMSSNYNSRPRAAEVLVRGDGYFVVRKRETWEDLVAGERIPPGLTVGSEGGRGMTGFPFTKMSGSGNDFIFMDHREVPWQEWDLPEMARRLCRRRISVGADGFVLLVPAGDPGNDFAWRFFNADGSEGEMCGNGARCAARFALRKGLAPSHMRFETLAGVIEARVDEDQVRVKIGDPTDIRKDVTVLVPGQAPRLVCINTGVPHAVYFVPEVESVDVVGLGRTLRYHDAFAPQGTNANFAEVVDAATLKVRTYERGVEDETLACGTGAVASAMAAHLLGKVTPPVSVIVRSGRTLKVHFQPQGEGYGEVYLEGDALLIYDGFIMPDAYRE